jgi:asparagine synthase (glutamine-hydrolysing)
MCGISGFYKFSPLLDSKKIQSHLIKALSHRGPDGANYFINDPICLVHNRLSIIDLSENGIQPLYNEDKSLVLICNGEIYNYQELRKELLSRGHRFRSFSDCEVILHLYEEYSGDIKKTLNRLTGMFALAIWDQNLSKLLIARDRIGIKPLYYSCTREAFSFSSEVKPLITSQLAKPELDYSSLYEYFNLGYIPEPNTLYKNIKALSPGCFLELSDGNISKEIPYWELSSQLNTDLKSEGDVIDALDSLLQKVVKDHLIADVKVGSFLSAGIDSSLISYYSALAQNGIPTFTAAFEGEPEDESKIAEATSRKINSTPYQFNVQNDFFQGLEDHFGFMDQPFGVSSALSLSRIASLAKPIVKVVLSGDGADELFAGYDRHSSFPEPPQLRFLPLNIRKLFFRAGYLLTSKDSLKLALEDMNLPNDFKYAQRLTLKYGSFEKGFLGQGFLSQVDQSRYLRRFEGIWNSYQEADLINRMLYTDVKTSLVDEMLVKTDRMTMHQGIEGRVPFLDHRVVEFAMQIPSTLKKRDSLGKVPLRSLVSKYLGPQLGERKKTGFNSPLKRMLQQDPKTRARFENEVMFLQTLDFLDESKLKGFVSQVKGGDFIPSQAFGLVALANYFKKV